MRGLVHDCQLESAVKELVFVLAHQVDCMRSRLRLEVEPAEAGKQLLTTESTDPHGNSTLMLPKNFGHRPLALVRIERGAVRHFRVFRVFRG